MQGDQILTVNGNDLRTASQVIYCHLWVLIASQPIIWLRLFFFQEQAAAILKTAMGKIDLKVGRLKAGAASPRSATSAES